MHFAILRCVGLHVMILHVTSAAVTGPTSLHVTFNDGTSKNVDLSTLLFGPVFEPLRDPAYFATVTVDPECRTIVWPNGADFAPEALYDLAPQEAPDAVR